MKVILYSKPNCPYCDAVKEFIANNNIQDVEFDNNYNVEKVRSFGFMTFPVLEVDGEAIAESDEIINKLKEIYKI
jgi:glutaredoxin